MCRDEDGSGGYLKIFSEEIIKVKKSIENIV